MAALTRDPQELAALVREGNRRAMTLRNLMANPNTARACKQLAEKIAQGDSLELACDVIEAS